MVSHVDDAIDSTEHDMKGEKTRGPRAKFFFCISWKPQLYECIEASSAVEAGEIFKAKHEVMPKIIDGGQTFKEEGGGSGFYLAKGTGMSDAQRISVTVSAEHLIRHTTRSVKAEFRGWIVFANCIKGFKAGNVEYKDNELVTILFDKPVDSDNKLPKPKLKKNEAVRLADLNILSEIVE